ncbi:hypothetical protein JCM33374_g1630 [Metschnikowia sp. JCM 33374]|nr:hypothetical protein JCM33374_g1630 [Metschnikowia sp. JCM 33374]
MSLDVKITQATDATLTGDNWQYIMDVCDTISSDPEVNTKAAIKQIKTRLAQKDANVVLRSLTLLMAMGENCGSRMQQEIASSSFLKDSLLSRFPDRKVHKDVKVRVAEVLLQLEKSFAKDPSLKAVADACATVREKYPQYLKTAPSKPAKTQLTVKDRQNEDAELERALSLSVQEYEREQSVRKSYLASKPLPETHSAIDRSKDQGKQVGPGQFTGGGDNSQTQPPGGVSGSADDTVTIASVKKVCALYDLISYEPDELSFKKGDIITVIESVYRDWWRGALPTGKVGIFPLNYVTPVVSKSPEELAREQKLEAALIDHESKKVDRLLALLSSDPDSVREEEVTDLYNSIVPLKPVLAKLIGKHSARKDELRALNDQVNEETKLYNSSIDNMISQRQNTSSNYPLSAPQYQAPPQSEIRPPAQVPPHVQAPPQLQNYSPQYSQYSSHPPAQNHRPSVQQGTGNGSYLEQQPTSAGFGNGGYNYGPGPASSPGNHQQQGQYSPQQAYRQSYHY